MALIPSPHVLSVDEMGRIAPPIFSSVGRGGANSSGDVFVIQSLLNDRLPKPHAPIPVTGVADVGTTLAIETYQAAIMQMMPPSGRVDPGSATYYALAARPLVENAPTPSAGHFGKVPPDVADAAVASRLRWTVPASVTVAQWAVESAWGASMPPGSNNPFGIKATGDQPAVESPTREVIKGENIVVSAHFRMFASLSQAFDEHGRLLATAPVYKDAMKQKDDPPAFADALTGVYATDPNYGFTLKWVMENYGLSQYKTASDTAEETPVSDNPFAEPEDDRTVIRPVPGGRRRPAPDPAITPAPLPQAVPTTPAFGVSPLAIAASPLLQLLAQLRAIRRPPNPQVLRERVVQDLRAFERNARDSGIAMELLRPSHYALCASIDDVVLNSPWGAASGWASQTLVATFHHGASGTDQFFDQLRQLWTAPRKFLPVLELMFFCLSLGFMGRYRQARGEGELERVRAATHAAIVAQRQAAPPELSQRWRGVAVPHQPTRHGIPVWVALAGAAALCGVLFLWTSTGLNAASDGLQAHVLATPPTHMPRLIRAAVVHPVPPPPAAAEPTALDRLRASLKPEIDRGVVSLLGTAATPVILVTDHAMFASGSADVQPASLALLERIAAALRNEAGSLRVIDHTDNQPVRSVRFPSNFQLSVARANAVDAIIAHSVGDPARVSAEGRADADPIASNATAEGREQNRRIEIVLHRQD